ncbi:1,4-alpha-glucan branching protein GlgB [Geminicoccaceae bacterium SYSU G07066]|uniref:1,4-alpha-glucan branching enzyme GlgB n=1 Tax=Benzoatithermus flavus TaxID=3108223 RepID=A0ABU8XME4_9PROT
MRQGSVESIVAGPTESWQRADPGAVQAIVEGRHGDPFAVLGMHGGGDQPLVVRTFQPGARTVRVLMDERLVTELERTHPAGFFEGPIPRHRERFAYRLRVGWSDGDRDIEDPYRFPPVLGDMDVYLLAEGTHLRLYEKLGAHPRELEGVSGTSFAVWAPNASRVSVIGDFNGWDGRRHPMRKRVEAGVWEIFLPGVEPGALYKFELLGPSGELLPQKADPFAFATERPPSTASVVHGLVDWRFEDAAWLARRRAGDHRMKPISIYECHVGSWRRVPAEGNRQLTWRELADTLVPYVAEMGFTHLELLPISEHPFEGSWGYQPIGLFAPSSRFGSPADFACFVDRCHQAGIGILLDWVPGHFPTDIHGLGRFDGTALYEHEDPRLGFHQDWSTFIYNFGRREVANFLWSNALFWLDRFHVDGLRVDAVASMLYLDYSRKPGEWIPNIHGGRENLEAIHFLRRLNELAYGEYPGIVTVAEESTAWPAVSRPVYLGGLGFGFKWNMGWMHDTLRYMSKEPIHRKHHMNDLTFGLMYAWSENFVLPLSHDEVVHGKGSLINKMPGDVWQKAANLRAYFAFMWTYPGKKLLFMGGEFGQWREWNHDSSLDWHLLDEGPYHKGLQSLVRDLNRLYREASALHELDCEPGGFEWIDCSDIEHSVIAYLRKSRDPDRFVVVVCNFTPVPRHGYRIGVPHTGLYRERVNTDAGEYGGSGVGNAGGVEAEPVASHGRPASLCLTLPPLATLILEPAASSPG